MVASSDAVRFVMMVTYRDHMGETGFPHALWYSLGMGRGQGTAGSAPGRQRQALDFIVPFNGTGGPLPEEGVSVKFDSLVTDTLLNHAAESRYTDDGMGRPHDHLVLVRPDEKEPGVEWVVGVKRGTEPTEPNDEREPFEEVLSSISIQRIKDGCGRDDFRYGLCSDGIVRRWDGGDKFGQKVQRRAAGVPDRYADESFGKLGEMIAAGYDAIHESRQNSRLETEMGVNNQPITLGELEGLAEFLAQPGFEVPAWSRKQSSPSPT